MQSSDEGGTSKLMLCVTLSSLPQALGVDDVLGFPFIDPPPRGALVRSLELLYALEALDDRGKLTAAGRTMARFPLEPMAAKALLAAQRERCAEDVCAVVAMLDTEGLFFTPKCAGFCSCFDPLSCVVPQHLSAASGTRIAPVPLHNV